MPIELKVEFTEESKSSAEILSRKSYVKKVDTRTIKIEDEDLLEALKKWWL
jgi:D-aminopeptidase